MRGIYKEDSHPCDNLFLFGAVGEVEIDERLIRHAGFVGQGLEIVIGGAVDVDGYLLFELFGIRILHRVGKILFILHEHHLT